MEQLPVGMFLAAQALSLRVLEKHEPQYLSDWNALLAVLDADQTVADEAEDDEQSEFEL